MDISGKLKLINETKEYGNNGFRKREVVITTEEQYPQDLMIEFIQDKCDLLNSFQVGQSVKVDINFFKEYYANNRLWCRKKWILNC